MSLTSNFDYCVELGIGPVKSIFHLAFKSEERFPHNIGPVSRDFSGQTMSISVRVMDDETDAADLSFFDDKHITFSFPFEVNRRNTRCARSGTRSRHPQGSHRGTCLVK